MKFKKVKAINKLKNVTTMSLFEVSYALRFIALVKREKKDWARLQACFNGTEREIKISLAKYILDFSIVRDELLEMDIKIPVITQKMIDRESFDEYFIYSIMELYNAKLFTESHETLLELSNLKMEDLLVSPFSSLKKLSLRAVAVPSTFIVVGIGVYFIFY